MDFFDRFAEAFSNQVSRAWFFCACILLILVWAPSIIFFDLNTWQLIINTLTTIITFLMVALLQNKAQQSENAMNFKLDAQSKALAELMEALDCQSDMIDNLHKSIKSETRIGARPVQDDI